MKIVIADGLTREVLSPERQFIGQAASVGEQEISRLMGRGRDFGRGPLPKFLREVLGASAEGEVGVLWIRDEASESDDSDACAPVEPLAGLLEGVPTVLSSSARIPGDRLTQAICDLTGEAESDVRGGRIDASFLVLGCHTDQRVLATAIYLRNVLGFSEVAVCSHLVGSAIQEAHFATLRHYLPRSGVEVILDLGEAEDFVGISRSTTYAGHTGPCLIEPAEARDALGDSPRRIVELIGMHWTKTELRPLAGGFSGSLLFLAGGWKGDAKTEPMVIKIDEFSQMRREMDGYHQVKDFFGKHVPTFGYPIIHGAHLGVGMELAAMEGPPSTLQDTFEEAQDEPALQLFSILLEKALALLGEKLYSNTGEHSWVVPYRTFGLHAAEQLVWLEENARMILGYMDEAGGIQDQMDIDQLTAIVGLVAKNPDGVNTEVCLQHGDLNLANVICDPGDNVWFIDWTHCGDAPLELDFAKLENDVKFVMSKDFDHEDLPRLKKLEDYLLANRIPPPVEELPDSLKFAKWDLRYQKIMRAVRTIRRACFALKDSEDWLLYRVALLRYATHTLSFDERRGRGECDPTQLMYALYSVEALAMDLVADDFHLKIRAERPESYPERQRISIDESLWLLDCEDYGPPYHVDPSVLENTTGTSGAVWAEPEDVTRIADRLAARESRFRDDEGRPRNPRGRTGIAGRGLLGLWGANLSLAGVVVRPVRGRLEILLGSRDDGTVMELPKGFSMPDEDPGEGTRRVMMGNTGWVPEGGGKVVKEGYTYDRRQTDHAWVEARATLFLLDSEEDVPALFDAGGDWEQVAWWPLDAETINRMPTGQADIVRKTLQLLTEAGAIDEAAGRLLLAKTG